MKLDHIELVSCDARKKSPTAPKTINTNINFTHVDSEMGWMKVDFEYTVNYLPDNSHLIIGGKASFSGPECKKCHEEWTKTGRISGPLGELVLNAINYNASMNAILVARAFNLAPPVVLPTLKIAQSQQTAAQSASRSNNLPSAPTKSSVKNTGAKRR